MFNNFSTNFLFANSSSISYCFKKYTLYQQIKKLRKCVKTDRAVFFLKRWRKKRLYKKTGNWVETTITNIEPLKNNNILLHDFAIISHIAYFKKNIKLNNTNKHSLFIKEGINTRYLQPNNALFSSIMMSFSRRLFLQIHLFKHRRFLFLFLGLFFTGIVKKLDQYLNHFFFWNYYKEHLSIIRKLQSVKKFSRRWMKPVKLIVGWSFLFKGKVFSYSGLRKKKFLIKFGDHTNSSVFSSAYHFKKNYSSPFGSLSMFFKKNTRC